MSNGVLNARLNSAAELVRQGAVFADIGTDHAYLPIFLLESGRIESAFCTDINEGPLNSARNNSKGLPFEDKMTFILSDGAEALSGRGITDYAICGMGGELIAAIIERAPHLKEKGTRLILQPMSRQSHLREYLLSHGFAIICESYSYDAGKYYLCILAEYTGECREIDACEAEIGCLGAEIYGADARVGYLSEKLRALKKAYNGKIKGGEDNPSEKILIEAIENELRLP